MKNHEVLLELAAKIVEEPENFDFASFTRQEGCYTLHCMAGWLPILHPEAWVDSETPHLIGSDSDHRQSLREYFDLPVIFIDMLFYPLATHHSRSYPHPLPANEGGATAYEVADNVHLFFELYGDILEETFEPDDILG